MTTLLLASLFLTTSALADFGPMPTELPVGHKCEVPANPDRGLPMAFTFKLVGEDDVGAMAVTEANGQERALGQVSKITVLWKSKPEQRPAFDAILGLIHEEDVSGIAPPDLEKLTYLKAYEIDHPLTELKLFRLFANKKQMGGTILMGGMGTRCLPKR